jgi:hypothetical protein
MANPLYPNNNPYAVLMQQAQELKKTLSIPRAEVERLLQSGQMTQNQFNSLAQQAQNILPFLK